MNRLLGNTLLVAIFLTSLVGCDSPSFNLAGVSDQFSQSVSVNNKVDIIWIVDGSGTMATHQENLARNFTGFIQQFRDKGFDFHMVVASNDAWVREQNYNAASCFLFYDPLHPMYSPNGPNPSEDPTNLYLSSADCEGTLATWGELTAFRDGDIYGSISGVSGARSGQYIITSDMNDEEMLQVFQTNVKTGTRGDGVAESTLSSLRAVLRRDADGKRIYGGETHTVLENFRRPDAFLAVITVSDEEDQSYVFGSNDRYANSEAYTADFIRFLDGYTGIIDTTERRYSISGIVLQDIANCPYELHAQVSESPYVMAAAQATRGITGEICSPDFYKDLENIAEKVITLATRFVLTSKPVVSTLEVLVDGQTIEQDSVNGWTYIEEQGKHYIEFNGTSVPSETSVVSVDFTPAGLK